MGESLQIFAPAKINLYLKVKGRRPDGYHELVTLMQKISLQDEIILERCASGIHLSCPDSDLPENRENIVFKAAELFLGDVQSRKSITLGGVKLKLYKTIPQAAGLGGGSSDAGCVLRSLNTLFDAGYNDEDLAGLGVKLGADVPLFTNGWPCALARGIGEILQPAPTLKEYLLVVVNQGFSVSTQWVFQNFSLTNSERNYNLNSSQNRENGKSFEKNLLQRLITPQELENDLELVTEKAHPEITDLKNQMLDLGAENAMMSGSGPTVFGLFSKVDSKAAHVCYSVLKKEFRKTYLLEPIHCFDTMEKLG